jgi:hypothetical protein
MEHNECLELNSKTNNQVFNREKYLHRQFARDNIPTGNKHMKRNLKYH